MRGSRTAYRGPTVVEGEGPSLTIRAVYKEMDFDQHSSFDHSMDAARPSTFLLARFTRRTGHHDLFLRARRAMMRQAVTIWVCNALPLLQAMVPD